MIMIRSIKSNTNTKRDGQVALWNMSQSHTNAVSDEQTNVEHFDSCALQSSTIHVKAINKGKINGNLCLFVLYKEQHY